MAIQLFLSIPGILGSSTLRGHENQIVINDFEWGVTNSGREALFAPLSITKFMDRASSQIEQAVVSGQLFSEIKMFVVQVDAEVFDLATYSFINNTINAFSQAGSEGLQVVENISIQPENVTFVFNEPRV